MNFRTFLRDLCLIELSDLIYRENDDVVPEQWPSAEWRTKLIPAVNSVLRLLYIEKRVVQKELVLQTSAHITTYRLVKEHAVTDPAPVDKYIMDALDPFTGDLARIDEVRDEHDQVVFSASENVFGGRVRMPRWDTLVFSEPADGVEYLVRFRASAPTMTENQDDEAVDLELPPGYVDLLRLRVAERVYGAQKTPESVAKAAQYTQEATALETVLIHENMNQEDGWDFDNRQYQKGFV